jgi:hypothetical protein
MSSTTEYGNVRQALRLAVIGPGQLITDDLTGAQTGSSDSGDSFFSGWRVLHLEVLNHPFSSNEYHATRTVYANWGDSQRPQLPVVVLRGSHLSRSYLGAVLEHPEPSTPVPARFVWIPVQQAVDWISLFTRLSVPIGEQDNRGQTKQRRRLIVDLGWTDRRFDKRWGVESAGHDVLNRVWVRVWDQMGVALQTAVPLTESLRLEEIFAASQEPGIPFHYDSTVYDLRCDDDTDRK